MGTYPAPFTFRETVTAAVTLAELIENARGFGMVADVVDQPVAEVGAVGAGMIGAVVLMITLLFCVATGALPTRTDTLYVPA
jgi:hypothetical protein